MWCVYDIIMTAAAATVIITCEARCVRIDKYCSRERHDLQEDLLKEEKTKWRERIITISLYVAAAASKHNNNNKNNNTRIG